MLDEAGSKQRLNLRGLIGGGSGCTVGLRPTDKHGTRLDSFRELFQFVPGSGFFLVPGGGHYPLLPASPAINAGSAGAWTPTDQLGNPRIGRCDIGAIEKR